MINAGDFTPIAEMGPTRAPGGATLLGRLTTSEEQIMEVREHLTRMASESGDLEVSAKILWPRGEPTFITARFMIEHLNGKRVYLFDRSIETIASGAEIVPTEAARLRILNEEISDLHERGML